jgi:2-methylaconitate cis-trans-isomerase PrpF
MNRMEAIRCAASVAMGLAPDFAAAHKTPSIPKVAMVAAPRRSPTLSGRTLAEDEMSIVIRMISIGQPHRAVPITGAICLGIACRIEGSIPHALSSAGNRPISVAHPSGMTVVDAEIENAADATRARAKHGAVYRTARPLFEGHVLYRARSSVGELSQNTTQAMPTAAE